LPEPTRLPTLGFLSGATASALGIAVIVIALRLFNKRSAPGYQSHISGINLRFAKYGGVDATRQTIASMCAGGAVAGLVGAHMIMGQSGRFVDGDLVGTGFAWTGLLVTLLALHRAVPILVAGLFFAALQVGGLAMQRNAGVSWQLAQVLQAIVILALVMRVAPNFVGRKRDTDDVSVPDDPPDHPVEPRKVASG
jgi:simple sugar transport system permease protein